MTGQPDENSTIRNESGDLDIDVDARVEHGTSEEHEAPDGESVEQIEKEREERLAPENRPVNAVVDNTQRDFDVETGEFTVPADEVENGPQPLDDTPDDD